MDNGYEALTNNVTPESCRVSVADLSECFICRDAEQPGQSDLGHFCDCKSLVAHQRCLLTWIKKGLGSEKRPRCNVCHAEYHLQNRPPWRSVARQWQMWLAVAVSAALLALVPYAVFRMMTAFQSPPSHSLFKAAAVCFGLLAETLLLKCLAGYCSSRYRKAELSSFSVRRRSVEGPAASRGAGSRDPSGRSCGKDEL